MHDIRYYIDEQCPVLLRMLRQWRSGEFARMYGDIRPDRLYIVGSGTSWNAAWTAAPFMEDVLGIEVTVCAPSSLPAVHAKRPLVVFISQGGQSTNTLRAIEEWKHLPSLALTGKTQCRVNEVCGSYVLLDCGPEDAGPKTKGYTCTILTLYMMAMEAALACGIMNADAYEQILSDLEACFAALPQRVKAAEQWVEDNASWLCQTPNYLIVGKGQAACVAKECVIKLVETILTPAVTFEFEEYLHGPISLINEHIGGVYLLPRKGDPDRERMLTVARYHAEKSGRVLIVSPDETQESGVLQLPAPDAWYTHPFVYVLPCQLIAAKLPAAMGVGNRGEQVFFEIDRLVDIKYGHIV